MKYEKWKTTTRCNQGGRGDEAGAGGGELPGPPDGGLNARKTALFLGDFLDFS